MSVKIIFGNSNKEYLLNNYEIGVRQCDPYFTSWNYTEISKKYGIEIVEFTKDPIVLELTIRYRGSDVSLKNKANKLFAEMEKDIIQMTPGKLYINESFLVGFFIERSTKPSSDFYGLEQELKFLAPYPWWFTEQHIEIKPISSTNDTSEESNVKKYPYSYSYIYPLLQTQVNENINHYTESDFQMKIYGPALSVNIKIEGHPYIVEYPVEEGEYMVIDSRSYVPREERLYIVKSNGEKENIFNYRSVEYSVFKKIPAGNITIDYPRTYGVDLTIFKERSEPLWNSSL